MHEKLPIKKFENAWEEIGFHKQLGGYMFNYILGFLDLIFGVVIGGLLISLLYPYPESKGYRDLAGMVFIWALPFLDFGVAFGIERFIGEWRVKSIPKMLEYIRFFMWYQLFSSLMKTTIFSFFCSRSRRCFKVSYNRWIFDTSISWYLEFFSMASPFFVFAVSRAYTRP